MKATGKEARLAGRIFTPIKMNVACLLFIRTRSPVEPVGFVKRICQDAQSGKQRTRSRYVNRLVPMTATGKATEQGLVELAQKVLGEVFDLSGKRASDDDATAAETDPVESVPSETNDALGEAVKTAESKPPPSFSVCVDCDADGRRRHVLTYANQFAIRPSIRNNNTLKRDVIINTVAGLINNEQHKVDLEKPDKVILIEVYQACPCTVLAKDDGG